MENIWLRGKQASNPYDQTAFQVLGLRRDVMLLAEIAQRVEERRQAVKSVPGFYTLGDRDLTLSDITQARKILFDPTRRILEEILEHNPEDLQVDEVERVLARLPVPNWPQEPPAPRHLTFLLRAVQALAWQIVEDLAPVEVPPFPLDLEPIPPFGLPDRDSHD